MSTFGIRQTFRTQSISRKIARSTDVSQKNDNSQNQTSQLDSNENLFDSNQNHFVNRVLNRSSSSVQKPSLLPINKSSSSSSSSSDSILLTQSERERYNAKMVSSRISLLKSYNKAVTRSEDHM